MRPLVLLPLFLLACEPTGTTKYVTDRDEDGIPEEEDCDDEDASVGTPTTYYADLDHDGHGDSGTSDAYCERPVGYVEAGDDCDDADADVYPGNTEVCDGKDNDCDGSVDNGAESTVFYADTDGDGYGDDGSVVSDCWAPAGFVEVGGDCDDADAAYNPGASEADCTDPNDYNCDGSVGYADNDADGFAACEECDDADATVFPGAQETCNGIDDDCDGEVDEDSAVDASTWYADADTDGYGDASTSVVTCDAPPGFMADNTDCDDTNADVSPAETEVCNGIDDDCDGEVDEPDAADRGTWYTDADGDSFGDPASSTVACDAPSGFVADSTDCDDTNTGVNPAATEYCDLLDNDCDGEVDEDSAVDASTWYADADTDGYGDASTSVVACDAPSGFVADNTDCDDADASLNPGEPELCNWEDDNCDGTADEGLPDTDTSGTADCKEVAVIASYGFYATQSSYTCEGLNHLDREMAAIDDALDLLGLAAVHFEDDGSGTIAFPDVSAYPVVVYHNGGWSAAGSASVLSALQSAADAGQGVLLWGDDVMKHAYNSNVAHGVTTLYDLAHLTNYTSNGSTGAGAEVVSTTHEVVDGVAGTVSDFDFYTDIDLADPAAEGEVVLLEVESSAYPAVVAFDDGNYRTVTGIVSVYTTSTCPVSDADGLENLEILFQNAVWWAGRW